MDIEELKMYKGITPVPADFDEYWDRALGQLEKTESVARFTLLEHQYPNAECYDLYFTGVGGAKIYAKHARPAEINGKIPALLVFHGYSSSSPDWFDLMGFVMAGFAVFALDCRGQGGKSEDVSHVCGDTYLGHIIRGAEDKDPDKLLYRNIFLDTVRLARIALDCEFVDPQRVFAHGGSQGGGLALACAALEPRIKKVAATYPFLCDYKKQYELKGEAFNELTHYFRTRDQRHEREDEFFTRLGYIDVKNLAKRIKADTLVITALCDTAVPAPGQFAAYNNMSCPKRHIIYPDFGHEGLRGEKDIIMKFFLED